jgi:hypothetical protein
VAGVIERRALKLTGFGGHLFTKESPHAEATWNPCSPTVVDLVDRDCFLCSFEF